MPVGHFELNPQRGQIWEWGKCFLTPKRDHVKTQTNESSTVNKTN